MVSCECLKGTGGYPKYNMLHYRCKKNDDHDKFIFQGGIVCCGLNEGTYPGLTYASIARRPRMKAFGLQYCGNGGGGGG